MDRSRHRPEIDWLKGFAILSVLFIHSKPLDGTLLERHLIDRAVPIFVVLFGTTSEMWWHARRHRPWRTRFGEWYRTRLLRLMVPMWAVLLLWWPLVTIVRPVTRAFPSFVVATFLGYEPWVGTGWFVTLVLELVLLFPFLRLAVEWIGPSASLVVSAVILFASHAYVFHVMAFMQTLLWNGATDVSPFFYFWIFPPQWFFAIVSGIVLARTQLRVATGTVVVCALLAFSCVLAQELGLVGLPYSGAVFAFATPPLTFVLLRMITVVDRWPRLARMLAWCGVSSWGIYLGQLLVHNTFYAFGYLPYAGRTSTRWAYFFCLLFGAVALVAIGNVMREALDRLIPVMSTRRPSRATELPANVIEPAPDAER